MLGSFSKMEKFMNDNCNPKNANECFCKKKRNGNICILCLNLSLVKDYHTYGQKMARNGRKIAIYESVSFLIRVNVYSFIKP